MVDIDDLRRLAMAMPEVIEKAAWGMATWRVDGRMFVWERPLRAKELAELGDNAPEGLIAGVRTEDLSEKEALLSSDPTVFFTTTHFDGHPAVLVRLDAVDADRLKQIVEDAWLARASKKTAEAYLAR